MGNYIRFDKFNDTVGSDGTEGVKKKNELKNPKSTEQDVDSDDGDSDSDDRDLDSDEEQNDREGLEKKEENFAEEVAKQMK